MQTPFAPFPPLPQPAEAQAPQTCRRLGSAPLDTRGVGTLSFTSVRVAPSIASTGGGGGVVTGTAAARSVDGVEGSDDGSCGHPIASTRAAMGRATGPVATPRRTGLPEVGSVRPTPEQTQVISACYKQRGDETAWTAPPSVKARPPSGNPPKVETTATMGHAGPRPKEDWRSRSCTCEVGTSKEDERSRL
jgi:hypothetical protein